MPRVLVSLSVCVHVLLISSLLPSSCTIHNTGITPNHLSTLSLIHLSIHSLINLSSHHSSCIHPSTHPSTYLSMHPPVYPVIYLSSHLSIHLLTYPQIPSFTYISTHPSTHLPVCYLPICLPSQISNHLSYLPIFAFRSPTK